MLVRAKEFRLSARKHQHTLLAFSSFAGTLKYTSPFRASPFSSNRFLFWAKSTSTETRIKTHVHPKAATKTPPFLMTFDSPINNLCLEALKLLFCSCVRTEMCGTDLLFEWFFMPLPFCSLIAHHLDTVPLTPWHITLLNKKKGTTQEQWNCTINYIALLRLNTKCIVSRKKDLVVGD